MAMILLVADDEWVVNDIAAAITDPATRIDHVETAAEAKTLLGERAYGLAIVDMQVGSMGGMAIIRTLRDAMRHADVTEAPILLLLDRKADEFLAGRAGADVHIVKPFTSQELRTTLAVLGSPIP